MVRETRHLWVGNLPENVREEKIIEHFKRYGRVESVKVLPKRGSEGGVAAFVDFVDIKSAQKAHHSINKMGDRDLRTDYNEPGTIPSAVRGLEDSLSIATRGRDVSGFTRGAGASVYGPSASLHSREGRYERRPDGAPESRERTYDHSAYGHHERGSSSSSSFDRQRHYDSDYYRDPRDRTLSGGASGSASSSSASTVGTSLGVTGGSGGIGSTGSAAGGSNVSTASLGGGGSASSGSSYFRSQSQSPSRFETAETRYEARTREPYTLASMVHRDLYREDRGRRGDRTYRHSRSRSPHTSQSHNVSPQRSTSKAARKTRSPNGSGTHSRSSSSDSVSSTSSSGSSSDSSSSSSDESPARAVQSAAVPAPSSQPLPPLDKDEPRKSFGIKVQNLPVRSTDTSLKDGLFHEFKKHGKVTSVQIHGTSEERFGLVFFRQQEDQEKALSASNGKHFFGMQIDVTAWTGPETETENEFRPLDDRIDEFHPKATRTLFIGNLEKTTTYHDLLNLFQRFGEIVDIDIKKVNGVPQYAFLQYCDIASVCKAIKKMDGEYLGSNRLKLGFGKSMPTTCVWLDGLAANITEQYLTRHFCRYGHVVKVVFDRLKGMALVLYNNIECAQAAVKETKGWKIGGNKIKVDFANHESQMAFYRSMQTSGQDIRECYDVLSDRRDERRALYLEFSTDRACYENVRTQTEDLRRKYLVRSREFYTEWDPYTTEYYDLRYYDESCEYRDHRDAYEQDIRKYSYMQRERNRDRERDHGRRTVEHNQSPPHPRRHSSPTASPSLSERLTSVPEHLIYSRSSDRSGSCSSVSPTHFEKPDKNSELYNKGNKLDKERQLFEPDTGNGGEKEMRVGRRDKGEKDRTEKQNIRKLKHLSPSVPSSETDVEPDRDASPDSAQCNFSKTLAKEKDLGKGKLDLPPCVVHLTRVKEKEDTLLDQAITEKQKAKTCSDPDSSLISPLTADHKTTHHTEIENKDVFRHVKVPKDKCLASQVEIVDKEGTNKGRRYSRADTAFEKGNSDADRLAARKRRFEEDTVHCLRKTTKAEEEGRSGLRRVGSFPKELEDDREFPQMKPSRGENKHDRIEYVDTPSTTDEPDSVQNKNRRHSDPISCLDQRMLDVEVKSQHHFKLKISSDGDSEIVCTREPHLEGHLALHYKDAMDDKERLLLDMNHSQSCRKRMDQSCHLQQQQQVCDTFNPNESKDNSDIKDLEHQTLIHETGIVPLNVIDVLPLIKQKKSEASDFELGSNKEWNSWGLKQLNSESERKFTPALVKQEWPAREITKTEMNSHFDELNCNYEDTVTDTGVLKTKNSPSSDEDLAWQSNIKHDTLKVEISVPSSIVKCESIRKSRVHDLEPGEVRSDSDDDDVGDITDFSLKQDTVYKRGCEERLLDLKLSGSLEKNKFYEFSLDKTITPDTKALLERAKSLSSSREDNWSFLDYESRFTCFRNSTDKDKVDSAPRPMPSWYMKKRKIRSDSEGKLDFKKENPKPEEQEIHDLFASRFLHSSIFEQDSKRLRHLECKDSDPEVQMEIDKSSITDKKAELDEAENWHEPIVLFHNRFLELQQSKDKHQEQHTLEKASTAETTDRKSVSDHEQIQCPKESKSMPTLKSTSPTPSTSVLATTKTDVQEVIQASPTTELSVLPVKKETLDDTQIDSPPPSSPSSIKAAAVVDTPPLTKNENSKEEPNQEISNIKETANTLHEMQNIDVKPPTPSTSLSNLEPESDPAECPPHLSPMLEDAQTAPVVEQIKTKTEHPESICQSVESTFQMHLAVSEPEVEPTQLSRKQPKNKKTKANKSALRPIDQPQPADTKKPVLRKSERIDREKLKRTSSRQGAIKRRADSKSQSKSPCYLTDMEINDLSSSQNRTRQRRNVRSVYATPHEEDAAPQQQGKDSIESSRSLRKRGVDKDSVQQETLTSNTRRGRPTKSHKTVDDLPLVEDQANTFEGDITDNPESESSAEITKVAVGWHSPRSQKVQSVVRAGQNQIAAKTDKTLEAEVSETLNSHVVAIDKTTSQEELEKNTEKDSMGKHDKSANLKVPRLTQSVNLKHLFIDLSGDTVKGALYSEHCQNSVKKTKTEISDEGDFQIPKSIRKVEDLSPDGREEPSDSEPLVKPEEALLARQVELERAVENISKLDIVQPPSYKEPPSQPPTVLQPVSEGTDETEVEKPANPASETELAAAIDSITAEDILVDTDGFHTPTFTSLLRASETVVSPTASEVMETETGLIKDSEASLTTHSKSSEPDNRTECPLPETQKKGARARPKTPKKCKGRKGYANKKTNMVPHTMLEAKSAVKLPESIPEDMQTVNPKAATSSAIATVVTVAAACKHDVTSVVTINTPKEAEQPVIDQPEPQESAFHSGSSSPSFFRSPEITSKSVSPTLTTPSAHLSPTLACSAKIPFTIPDWRNRTEEKGVLSISHVTVVASAPGVVIGSHLTNPAIPPDTKASDIDPKSSTLRKILMEPKYVSASDNSAVTSTLLTNTLTSPRMSQNENVPVVKSVPDDRPSPVTPVTPQMVFPEQPTPQPSESFKENMGNSVISSTATSVISRIPLPLDFDKTPYISLGNRSSGLSPPKQKYHTNENSWQHELSLSDDPQPTSDKTDKTSYNPGSGPGLRVNTSEGVVVLSYSGQKTEGPQRIIAKISQIPPPNAVDIEFQQSVSRSQFKQDPIQPQPSTPKGSQTPTGQGYPGAILSTQRFNAQPVISSITKDGTVSGKSESIFYMVPQCASAKKFQPSSPSSQILRYNQSTLQQHITKTSNVECISIKAEVKQSQPFCQSPVSSPHPYSLAGNHISSPTTPNDRLVCHPKHEIQSARTSGNSVSSFSTVCPPKTSIGLGSSRPGTQYVKNHPEQSVIMPPHNATQVSIGHLSQGSVRMNTPPLVGINYNIHTDSVSSSPPGPQQCSISSQTAVLRDILVKTHPSAGQISRQSEVNVRHFHQAARQTSVPQLHTDGMVVPEYNGIKHGGLKLDQYNRDLRILMQQKLPDHLGVVKRYQAQTSEPSSLSSSTHISSTSSKTATIKNLSPRDAPRALAVKMSHSSYSPHLERTLITHSPGSVMSQQVQLIHPGNAGSMPELYREMHGFRSQLAGPSVIGSSMANCGIASNQESLEVENRPKTSHCFTGGPHGETKLTMSDVRHAGSIEMSHVYQLQRDNSSPCYISPTAKTPKSEPYSSLQKGPQSLPSGLSSLPPTNIRPDINPSVDMVQLLKKYPIVWQGHLALKNESAAVQLHFVSGNKVLAQHSLPPPEGGPPLRIAQRMRLEASQLEGVARRMTTESDYCLLLALPCGLDQKDVLIQTHALKTCFITYLQAKQAAGIINVANPGSNQPVYVVQIFPPCEFSEIHLSHLAPDLLKSISSISPHLMIVIASV
ncbi:msx2-interacting protein [Trichomycterus rosablanca]|uniref:msx2-interacting protein n=1 Tax=Trichomycterus rosablanca TaxID=2290929 RepID=UPI002F354A8A